MAGDEGSEMRIPDTKFNELRRQRIAEDCYLSVAEMLDLLGGFEERFRAIEQTLRPVCKLVDTMVGDTK